MAINFELYKVFLAVATNRSFSKAAEELSVTQSAVSQSVSKLESLLGKKLFDRSNSGLTLTDDGKYLYENISTGCNILSSAENKLKENQSCSKKESLKIACSPLIFKKLVFPILSELIKGNMSISANSLASDKDKVFFVKENLIDFCLIKDYGIPLDLDLVVKKVFTLHYVFFYNPKYFNIDNTSDIANHPLIIKSADTKGRKDFDKLFSNISNNCKQKIEVSHDELVITATESGLGVGFAPREYISKNMKVITPPAETSLTKDILLITKSNTKITDKLASLIQKMQK